MKKINISLIIILILILALVIVYFTNNSKEYKYEVENEQGSIESIEDFYNLELTRNKDIRNLGEYYNVTDAVNDNSFVIAGAKVYNDNLYTDFIKDYNNKTTSFIRVAQTTIEGDLILTDILYFDKTNKIYVIKDNTRDRFSSSEERIIELKEYQKTDEINYKNNLYWVLFNGDITQEKMESNDVFIVATIN